MPTPSAFPWERLFFYPEKNNKMSMNECSEKTATMTVQETAKLLGVSPQCVRVGLESGAFRFGTVVRMKRKVYVIYRSAVEELIRGKEDK